MPPSATAWTSDADGSPFRPAPVQALGPGSRARVELGALSLDVEVALVEPPLGPRMRLALGAMQHQALSLAFHAGLLALLSLFVPRLGSDVDDAEEHAERVAFLLHALDGSAMREREDMATPGEDDEPPPGQGGDGERGGGTGSRARGEEGSPGSSVSTTRGGHVAVHGPPVEADPHLAREAALREAATFGVVVGLLPTPVAADPRAPVSPWGRETSSGTAPESTRAPLRGESVGDAFAWGGLALSGTGEGGGGRAEAIGSGISAASVGARAPGRTRPSVPERVSAATAKEAEVAATASASGDSARSAAACPTAYARHGSAAATRRA